MPSEFVIGTVVLFATEVPQQLDGIGGKQILAVHEFPGGIKTAQTFGAFPAPIKWDGVLTGTLALERAIQLDRLRVAGQQTLFLYNAFAWQGYVRNFVARPKHEWLVPYELTFEPIVDLTGGLLASIGDILPEAVFNGVLDGLEALQQGTAIGLLPLPAPLIAPVAVIIGIAVPALAQSPGGQVANISTTSAAALIAAAEAVKIAARPLLLLTDATQSSPAQSAYASVSVLEQLVLSISTLSKWTVNAINPNLFLLAAKYYGDATQWQKIATANSLVNPFPIGSFTLSIPPP